MRLKADKDILELEIKQTSFLKEVLVGLSKSQKSIPPKFLYDKKGSEIFEEICKLPEYYPTRVEIEILKQNSQHIVNLIGHDALIIEPGSGSGEKIKIILNEMNSPSGYVPIEISREILLRMTENFSESFPKLKVFPICADFTQHLDLPVSVDFQSGKKIIFFPGSTIGNFSPPDALNIMKSFHRMMGPNGGLIIGVDLKKDKTSLEMAYDDAQGVTAAFNLNLLERLNREVNGSFNLDNFEHHAFYNDELGRVEMHLKSSLSQLVKVNQTVFRFREGETIHTESSYKYTNEEFCELVAKAHLKIVNHWKDENNMFCVFYFERQ